MRKDSLRLFQDILRKNVEANPDKVGLICEQTRLTYGQLDEMSNRLAHAFREHGLQNGDRVLFYLLNCTEFVVGIFAALKADAVFAGVDSTNTYESLLSIASDCTPTVLVTFDNRVDVAARLMADVPSLRATVLVGSKSDGLATNILSFNAIQERYPSTPRNQRSIDLDLAFLIYTSGSTGKSKGVMVTHRGALFTASSGAQHFRLTENDVHVSALQLSFSPGANQLLQTFMAGTTLILERSLAFPVALLKRMQAEGATGLAGVPTILTLLMQQDLSRYDLSRFRYLTSVGAALSVDLIRQIRTKLPHVSIFSFYGMAEAAYALGLQPEEIDQYPLSVGKPFPGTQAFIVDEEGHRVGPNQVGQLVLRGSHVRSGYWNAPELSAQRYHPGPLPGETVCYTGDMFRTDEDGRFYFSGRSDETIKSGAKKVVPKEIEDALYRMPGILEAAAVPMPDPILGHVIKVVVAPTAAAKGTFTAEDVLLYCKATLEPFKVPREVEIRDSLPKTSSGKIHKMKLT